MRPIYRTGSPFGGYDMKQTIDNLLLRYGTRVTLSGMGGERDSRCFFQPVNSTSWQSIESSASPLGEITRGQYTYIGSTDVPVMEGDSLSIGSRNYLVRRTEVYYFHDTPLYVWALCVEKGVNDIWGFPS